VLDVPAEAVDADLFASLVDGGARLRHRDPGAAREVLRRGLSLWRGEPYGDLADHVFLRVERMRLEELRAHALEERIAADLDVGDHRRVLAELSGLIVHDPLRERLSVLHALALYRNGRQAEALEVFERLRHTLADESGIDPGTEVRRLHEQVLRQDPALDWQPPAATSSAWMKTAATARPSVGHSPDERRRPLIGRKDEFDRLDHAWAQTVAGSGGVLLVAGDPGIGKTHLVEELVHSVAARGGATAWGATRSARAPVMASRQRRGSAWSRSNPLSTPTTCSASVSHCDPEDFSPWGNRCCWALVQYVMTG
jgi:hypothetical protein